MCYIYMCAKHISHNHAFDVCAETLHQQVEDMRQKLTQSEVLLAQDHKTIEGLKGQIADFKEKQAELELVNAKLHQTHLLFEEIEGLKNFRSKPNLSVRIKGFFPLVRQYTQTYMLAPACTLPFTLCQKLHLHRALNSVVFLLSSMRASVPTDVRKYST